jgi:hypothetical protein
LQDQGRADGDHGGPGPEDYGDQRPPYPLGRGSARALEAQLGFAVDLSHVTISGWCLACRPAQLCQPAETSD